VRKKVIENVVLSLFAVTFIVLASTFLGVWEYRDRDRESLATKTSISTHVYTFDEPGLKKPAKPWSHSGVAEVRFSGDEGRLHLSPSLAGQRAILVNNEDVFKGYRSGTTISFDAYIPDKPGSPEIGIFFFVQNDPVPAGSTGSPGRSFEKLKSSGYHIVLGAEWNSHAVLMKNGRIRRTSDSVRLNKGAHWWPGRPKYNIEVSIEGCEISLLINGRRIFSLLDEFPLGLDRNKYRWGFYTSSPGLVLDNIVVSKRGVARFEGPLERGDDHYLVGNYRAAIERYSLAKESFMHSATAARAGYFIGLCKYMITEAENGSNVLDALKELDSALAGPDPSPSFSEFRSRAALFRLEQLSRGDR
jgi:hypothetical protein